MNRATVAVVLGVAMVVPVLALGQGGDAQRGNDLFHKNCASCHGDGGKGDGPAAAALNPKPRDLSDKAYMGGLNDQYLHDIIQKGGVAMKKSPLMPALGGALKDDQIADIVAYVRTLAR